jgi:type I restriction enzyme S subunit
MGLTKHKLGDLIQLLDIRNADLEYGFDDVRGVNNLKELMPTKADISGRDLSKFQIVHPYEFVFNHRTSRNGSKFSIAYNDTEKPVICTEDYVVFRITDEAKKNILLARWLYMFFKRPEFDRYVITNSWGSSTEFYNWEDICEIELSLPPISIQQKYVDVYNAMLANQQSYERGLEDLNTACEALLEKYKRGVSRLALGKLISEVDVRNDAGTIESVQGVNKDKQFMPSVASSSDILKYKIVSTGQFAVNLMHVGRDIAIPVAMNTGEPIIVSPAYTVFEVKDKEVSPEFVLMWLSRSEIDRLAWFMSDTNVRSGMEKARFYEIEIPMPSLTEQKSLVEIFQAMDLRKRINDRLKERIKNMCPILIKGSLEEAGA